MLKYHGSGLIKAGFIGVNGSPLGTGSDVWNRVLKTSLSLSVACLENIPAIAAIAASPKGLINVAVGAWPVLSGVAEWRMPNIVSKSQRFGQIFIQIECCCNSSCNLGYFNCVS